MQQYVMCWESFSYETPGQSMLCSCHDRATPVFANIQRRPSKIVLNLSVLEQQNGSPRQISNNMKMQNKGNMGKCEAKAWSPLWNVE